jgi:hypothetical protein
MKVSFEHIYEQMVRKVEIWEERIPPNKRKIARYVINWRTTTEVMLFMDRTRSAADSVMRKLFRMGIVNCTHRKIPVVFTRNGKEIKSYCLNTLWKLKDQ